MDPLEPDAPHAPKPAIKPLPKAVQRVVLVLSIAAFVGIIWLFRPATKSCSVKESFHNTDICMLTGTLKAVDETNKALNGKTMGGAELDEILLKDSTGTRTVYFDPRKLRMDGRTTATVTGKEVQESGSGVQRFVARAVE